MTNEQFERMILDLMPNAVIGTDKNGEIVIATGLRLLENIVIDLD